MKIRRRPEDFRVREITALPISGSGSFTVYELRKRSWTTLDALERIAREFQVQRGRVAHAGLKDRHAETLQVITIAGGPNRELHWDDVSLFPIGRSPRAIRADDIAANEFQIVARSLSNDQIEMALSLWNNCKQPAIPNYFDDQRFGSIVPGQEFIAEAWIRENYERAIRLQFAERMRFDSGEDLRQKEILQEHWGDWKTCKALLSKSHRRSIITFLDDRPGDFKGAWARVNTDLRGLALSALQSDLWNHIVAAILKQHFPGDQQLQPLEFRTGPLPVLWKVETPLPPAIQAWQLPLPSARSPLPIAELQAVQDRALAERGWERSQLKVKFPRDRFFSRAMRPVWLVPRNLSITCDEDDLAPGRHKALLKFSLPRGAYATLVLKWLFRERVEEELASDDDSDSDAAG